MNKPLRNGILFLLSILLILSAGFDSYADEVVFGDADGDGQLTAQDASCISRHLNRFRMLDAAALSRADYDGDGVLTELDSSLILSAFMSPDLHVSATYSFSMLLTSEWKGNAWDPTAADDSTVCTAVNTASCIAQLMKNDPDLLLFDVGGSIFGSSIADDYSESTERSYGPIPFLFMQLHYDAVILGEEAYSYPSQMIRREVNALQDKHIPVLSANLLKSEPTIFDKAGALWDDVNPYVVIEVPQADKETPLRVAVIGMTDPLITSSEDEIAPADPIEIYAKLRKEMKDQADYTVLLYHGSAEVDAQGESAYSLRDLIKKTDSIDLVVTSHGNVSGVRAEKNADGCEIPIVSLKGGVETVTKVSVSLRETGRPAILVEEIDASTVEPDPSVKGSMRPYVSRLTGIMDAKVCKVEQRIGSFDPLALYPTDAMDLIHEMQLYAAQDWIDYHDVDLPGNLISIAYPYIHIGDIKEGTLKYRDIYTLASETPVYTLMLVRGAELRAWLRDYAGVIMQQETIYSLYGLSYLLNTMNPETPLGFLEHGYGRSVDDDELFTLILAEKAEGDLDFRAYLDEEWMSYDDRIIEGFTLPKPYSLTTMNESLVTDALAAYLENAEILKFDRVYTWVLI